MIRSSRNGNQPTLTAQNCAACWWLRSCWVAVWVCPGVNKMAKVATLAITTVWFSSFSSGGRVIGVAPVAYYVGDLLNW